VFVTDRRQTFRFQLTYLAGVTGVHCADAIFHLPELCTNTTVVASFSFSFGDLVVRTARRYRTL
jgi:hypothetical protein